MTILGKCIQVDSDSILSHMNLIYWIIEYTAALSVLQTIRNSYRCIVILFWL